MSIEDNIHQALAPLVSGRVFRDLARQPTVRPYITFQQVGGQPLDFLESALPSKDNGRFQVNVWADDRDQASLLGRSARRVLVEGGAVRASTLGGMVASYESAVGLFGTRQDFSIWFDA